MALRLRRLFSLSHPLLNRSLHRPKPISQISSHLLSTLISATSPAAAVIPSSTQLTRSFTSTSALFAKAFDPETDEIGPDTILFEGCDYNHWLITVDFKDSDLNREQMIETYVNIAAQVFGSVEEAKKRIYALSTTTYQGFQVECPEDVSERFKDIPGVVFVLPDSYIDPVNKQYGGDKYDNGEITPRPPPVHYGRQNRDNRRRRDDHGPPPRHNYGPSQQQNYGPSQQQNYGPPRQQNNGPPQQQNYGPPQQQNYGPPQQQNYGPPQQQSYGPPQQQSNGPPQQQSYVPSQQQSYGPPQQQRYGPPQQPSYAPPQQQNYGPPQQQNYGPPQQQNYVPPQQQGYVAPQQQGYGSQQNYVPQGSGYHRSSTPPSNDAYQGGFDRTVTRNQHVEGQRDFQQGNFQSHTPPQQSSFLQETGYGSSRVGTFEQVPGPQKNFSTGNN